MRLADFILTNTEQILAEWEDFARTIWPGAATDPVTLRDHAKDILRATASDMKSFQTDTEQSNKSKGEGPAGQGSDRVDRASDVHAVGRVGSGFDLLLLVAEYRALRASVVRLWRESGPSPDLGDIDDLTRFHESIDQSLTIAIGSFTTRVDRSRQMFLAILGHDLRNPLNSMLMSGAMLARTGGLSTEMSRAAAGIAASATAMGQMISDLLDFTGVGLGAEMPIEPAPIDLRGLCQEVVNEIRAAHPTRTVRFDARGDLTGVWDAARMRQLVSNLLGNAVQHGNDSDPVVLTAEAEEDRVHIECRNGGAPIPPEALPTIFDPLVRVPSSDPGKRRRPGSIGLGLYIAREVATAHGGTINVTSTTADGTVFTVRLPRGRNAN